MSTKYKAKTTEDAYFITITTVGWVDFFYTIKSEIQYLRFLKILSTKQRIRNLCLLYNKQPYSSVLQSNKWFPIIGCD